MNLPVTLIEPHAPAPVGDRWPCHWFSPEVEWPAPVGPVLRRDRPVAALPRPVRPEPQGARATLAVYALAVGLLAVAVWLRWSVL